MNNVAIEVQSLWKKFHCGELHDSLRDFIPAVAKRLLGRGTSSTELGADDFWALRDVTFELRRGEALGVIGANGAGKSTLLKILSRIMRPNRGQYRVNGRLRALLEVGAGFHNDLTGRENVYLNGSILGMKKREIDAKLDGIIDFAGIETFIDTPVKRYSSGMRARLGFAVMAHMEPEILLVDEVLAVGDAAFRNKCVTHMRDLIRSEASVVFVSHHLDQVRQLCDRCLVLQHGRVRFEGSVEPACQEYMDSFHERASAGSHNTGGLAKSGALVELIMLDEDARPTTSIEPHHPITVQVTYELAEPMKKIGLAINFFRSDERPAAHFNTVLDDESLPCSVGKHRVSLKLAGLPFSGGNYFIRPRLLDVHQTKTLDVHAHGYAFTIEGPLNGTHILQLQRSWKTNGQLS